MPETNIFNKSIIKKKRKMHDKIVLPAKAKLSSIEVLHSRALINSYISHDVFFSIHNVWSESDDMKEAIRNLKTSTVHQKFNFIV